MPSQTFLNLPKEKQDRIMNASIHEMGIHTFENLNIANIIRASKIPRGSFYQYFHDKEDLYNYFYQYIGKKKIAFYGNLFQIDYDIPFIERFYQLYMKGFEFAMSNFDLVLAGKKAMLSEHFIQANLTSNAMTQAIHLFAEFIKKDQKSGRIRENIDAELLAGVMLELLNKITFEEYLKEDIDLNLIEIKIRQFIEIFQKGIE